MNSLEAGLGINAGFLIRMGEHHLYFTDPRSKINPFTNPHVRRVFAQASAVVVNDLKSDKERDLLYRNKIITLIRQNFLPEELVSLTQFFAPQLQIEGASPSILSLLSSNRPEEAFLGSLLCLPSFLAQQEKREDPFETEASTLGKTLERLFGDSFENTITDLDIKRLALTLKGSLSPLIQTLANSLVTKEVSGARAKMVRAHEHGSFLLYRDSGPTDVFREQLSSLTLEKTTLAQDMEIASRATEEHMEAVAGKMAELMRARQGLLFVLPAPYYYDTLLRILAARCIPISAPIRENIKVVGLLWEIRNPAGKKGYLFGSIHQTTSHLTRFNREVWKCLNESTIVAIEVSKEASKAEEFEKYTQAYLNKIFEAQRNVLLHLTTIEKTRLLQRLNILCQRSLPGFPTSFMQRALPFLLKTLRKLCEEEMKYTVSFEEFLIEEAKKRNLPVKALEDIKDHFSDLADDPRRYIITLEKLRSYASEQNTADGIFLEMKREIECTLHLFDDLVGQGMIEVLDIFSVNDKNFPEDENKFITRNERMANRIDYFIRSGEIPFASPGCSHLGGSNSILSFLERLNYSSSRIICYEPDVP